MPVQDTTLFEQICAQLGIRKSLTALRELVADLQPYDLSLLLGDLEYEQQLLFLAALPPETAAETLEHFEPVEQYHFLDHLKQETTAEILNLMSSDAVVELFTALHPRQSEQLFALLREPFHKQIRDQMSYPENSAGSLVSVDYIAARRWWTAEQTLSHLRKVGSTAELYNYVYILGSLGELVGVLSLRQLILAHPETVSYTHLAGGGLTVRVRIDAVVNQADLLPGYAQSGQLPGQRFGNGNAVRFVKAQHFGGGRQA